MNTVHPKLVHTEPQTLQRTSVIAENAGCSQSAGSKPIPWKLAGGGNQEWAQSQEDCHELIQELGRGVAWGWRQSIKSCRAQTSSGNGPQVPSWTPDVRNS